jgi:hypothetical protein
VEENIFHAKETKELDFAEAFLFVLEKSESFSTFRSIV